MILTDYFIAVARNDGGRLRRAGQVVCNRVFERLVTSD